MDFPSTGNFIRWLPATCLTREHQGGGGRVTARGLSPLPVAPTVPVPCHGREQGSSTLRDSAVHTKQGPPSPTKPVPSCPLAAWPISLGVQGLGPASDSGQWQPVWARSRTLGPAHTHWSRLWGGSESWVTSRTMGELLLTWEALPAEELQEGPFQEPEVQLVWGRGAVWGGGSVQEGKARDVGM